MRRHSIGLVLFATCMAAFALVPPTVQAAFPGAPGKIAFTRNTTGGSHDILIADPNGGVAENLTNSNSVDDMSPAWSGDGAAITWWSVPFVYVMNADGSNQRLLRHGGAPSLSADGSLIAYGTTARFFPASNSEIFAMRSDGSDVWNVTNDPLGPEYPNDYTPAWSPDGAKIAFTSNRAHSSFEGIYTINADGSGIQPVTVGQAREPDWSPDGLRLTFDRFGDIYVINADGTGEQRLTSTLADDQHPVWSPDGRQIAFHRARAETAGYDIYVMDADGSGEHLAIANGREPDWQPIPNGPPDCSSVAASRQVLTTHNRRLVPVTLDGASDPDGDPVTIAVDGVTQDEPVTSSGDSTSPDAIDEGEGELRVRAERNRRGDGRVYRIAFGASDGRGGSCTGTATVAVPRKRSKAAVDSAPPSYDSFGH